VVLLMTLNSLHIITHLRTILPTSWLHLLQETFKSLSRGATMHINKKMLLLGRSTN
jgi:hypothetical protein